MDFLEALFMLLDGAAKRARRAPNLARPAGPPPAAGAGAHGARPVLGLPPLAVSAARAASAPADAIAIAATPRAPGAEAGLVANAFANPRNLAAAFIVAEVLAKPVALRDP